MQIWPDSWAQILFPQVPLAELVVRAAGIYIFLLILMRAVGRREVGRVTLSDVLVMVLLATSVRRGLVPEPSGVGDAMILATLLVLSDWLHRYLMLRVPVLRHLMRPKPLPIIRDGEIIPENAQRALLTRGEIEEVLRLQGIPSVAGVAEAFVEPEGKISIIPAEKETHKPGANGTKP